MKKGKALVVFSGGQDSTTCLLWALDRFEHVEAITFSYGQRHISEIEQATWITSDLGVEHHVIPVPVLNLLADNSALTRSNIPITEGADGQPPNTVVDGRNMVFLTCAAIHAKSRGIDNIITGVCETDFSGYPDCRDVFIKSLNVTLNLSMAYDFKIHTPLMWLDKAMTWALADAIGMLEYVYNNTVTCYNGVIAEGCGTCPACELRRKGYDQFMDILKGGSK